MISEKDILIRNFIATKKRGSTYYFEHPKLHSCDKNFEDFEFDKSWNWLMPVIEKISKIHDLSLNETISWLANEFGHDGVKELEDMYEVVVAFIHSHNEGKSMKAEDKDRVEKDFEMNYTNTKRNVRKYTYG